MMAKSKLVLAILGIVFLLLNPAGVCAGTPSAQPNSHASHPCCPPPGGSTQHQQNSGSCVCIDRQPASPVLPSLADSGMVAVVTESAVGVPREVRVERGETAERAGFDTGQRFLTFHQILI